MYIKQCVPDLLIWEHTEQVSWREQNQCYELHIDICRFNAEGDGLGMFNSIHHATGRVIWVTGSRSLCHQSACHMKVLVLKHVYSSLQCS